MRSLHPLLPALILAAGLRPLAAPAWAPDRSIGGGKADKLVLDGSRVCAATAVGVYCRERNQEAWHPAFLAGKYVVDLVRMRSGWLAWLSERETTPPYDYATNLYVSRDGGAQWKPGRFPLENGLFGQQGLGDSLVRNDAGMVLLSKDGGETWDTLPAPLENTRVCTLSPGAVLCASKTTIFSHAGNRGWTIWGAKNEFDRLDVFDGRIYVRNSEGVLSEFAATGLVRKLPPLPGFGLFFASDSLLIVHSGSAYAFARGKDTAWTLSPAPYASTGFHPQGGVWQDNAAIVLGGFGSPSKARIEGGRISFEPFGQGIPSLSIRRLFPSGRALLAQTENAIWRSDAPGLWKPVFQRESWISPFHFVDGKAMVGSYGTNAGLEEAAPSRFSDDSGKTWQDAPASLPGFLYAMTRVGDRYLALTGRFSISDVDSSVSQRFSLYESEAWMGPWKFRSDYGRDFPTGLIGCGPRLFTHSYSEALTSLDTGKTWMPTGYWRVLEAGGDRVYAVDSVGGLWEARNCVEAWARVPVSPESGGWQVNRTRGEPLVAAYHLDSASTRIHPLPGASSVWTGVEAFPLPGIVESLVSREDALHAVVRDRGLFVLDMGTSGLRPGPGKRPAGTPGGFSGWRRVDGRAMPAGAPARIPLFRPALPE